MEVQGLPDHETDMINPDFAMVAQAMGFKGVTVNHPGAVKHALQEAFLQEGPVLINIMTNPDSLAMPPKVEWEQVKEYALSMTKLILGGRLDEVMGTLQSNYKHVKELI